MLMALNDKNELILANEKLCRKEAYYCPACKNLVHLKIGVVMCTHFAHFKMEACNTFSEGETEEHVQGKLQIKAWLEQVTSNSDEPIRIDMEAYLPELKQRPDLLVRNNKENYAIEFQCSSIPIEQVVERTNGYLKHDYQVIWVLGERFKLNKTLTSFQKACLYSAKDKNKQNLKLLHYNVQMNKLMIYSHFSMKLNQKLSYRTDIINFNKEYKIKKRIKQPKYFTENKIDLMNEHEKLRKELQYPSSKSRRFFQLLYQKRESIISLPKELYYTVSSEWMIQNYPFEWKYHVAFWLESLPKRRIITENYLIRWLKKMETEEKINYYEIPQLSIQHKLAPFYEVLDFLTKEGNMKKVGEKQWRMLKPLKRFKNLETKYNSFNSK